MAMTNSTMAPEVLPNPGSDAAKKVISAEAIKLAADIINKKNLADKTEAEFLSATQEEFNDQAALDEKNAALALAQQQSAQGTVKAIKDLTESDAYNFDVAIAAVGAASPEFLMIRLKDSNYVARWCNRHSVRQAALVAKGFRPIKKDEVSNLETLEMFLDSQDNFVYSDLVAMKVLKNVYYAGLRKAYLDSLRATNNKKAAEAGAAFAKGNLTNSLSGSERSYLAQHEVQGTAKPIYNPPIGV
jgi:hypothetical protein